MFSIYIDELIENLEKSGKGCWVGKQFYGVLVYADDIKLLAPSLTALQSMVDMCKRFGDKNDLFFNSKKTMCIKFHESAKCSPIVQYPITHSGKLLKWFSSVKHLGHIFDCCPSFTKDVVCKKGKFVVCVNNIVTEFVFAHPRCKAKMVNTYGTSFLWLLSMGSIWARLSKTVYNMEYCHENYT